MSNTATDAPSSFTLHHPKVDQASYLAFLQTRHGQALSSEALAADYREAHRLGDEEQRVRLDVTHAEALVQEEGEDGGEGAASGDDAGRARREIELAVVHDDHRALEAKLEEVAAHAEEEHRQLHDHRLAETHVKSQEEKH